MDHSYCIKNVHRRSMFHHICKYDWRYVLIIKTPVHCGASVSYTNWVSGCVTVYENPNWLARRLEANCCSLLQTVPSHLPPVWPFHSHSSFDVANTQTSYLHIHVHTHNHFYEHTTNNKYLNKYIVHNHTVFIFPIHYILLQARFKIPYPQVGVANMDSLSMFQIPTLAQRLAILSSTT